MEIFEEHRSTSAVKTRRETDRETNLERSAAAGPFPLCRTAHASFDPENYLKSTEGRFRRAFSKDTIHDDQEERVVSAALLAEAD